MDKYNQNIDIPHENISKPAPNLSTSTSIKKINPKIITLIGLLGLGLLSLIVTFIAQNDFPNQTNSSSSKQIQSFQEAPTPISSNPWQIELNTILNNLTQETGIPSIALEERLTF